MFAQIVDAVGVVDAAIGFLLVELSEAVLHDHEGDLVAVVHVVEREAQTIGVDLPTPGTGLEIGVLAATDDVALSLLEVVVGADEVGHVVAEAQEVDLALFQVLCIGRGPLDLDALLLPHALDGTCPREACDLDRLPDLGLLECHVLLLSVANE